MTAKQKQAHLRRILSTLFTPFGQSTSEFMIASCLKELKTLQRAVSESAKTDTTFCYYLKPLQTAIDDLAEMQKCRNAEMQKCRNAEMQKVNGEY